MTPGATIEELRARLQLAAGSATLLLVVAESEAVLREARALLLAILEATPLAVADLGVCGPGEGPAYWAATAARQPAEAFFVTFSATSALAAPAFARRLNAERQLLRTMPGPLVLLVSRASEKALRQHAPDFYTWAAQTYTLPAAQEFARAAERLGFTAAAPHEEPIRFLHISDLHLRPKPGRRYDQDRVLEGLLAFLERDREGFPLDLIFVTGDLAHGGKPEEYTVVVELLERVMALTRVPSKHVFVVPGNHDVDRDVGRWLLRTLATKEDSVTFFVEAASRTLHQTKLRAYAESMRRLLGAERAVGLGVGAGAVEIVEIRGARLAIASLNSAWFAQGDDDHGRLWLGEPSVEAALDRVADDEAHFAIALMHHPMEFLHEDERDVVETWAERGFDLLMRGHLHADKTRAIISQRGGYVEVAAPAAYQGSQWRNGCFLGEIRPRARTVRLRPFMFASGPDPWVLDTKVFPDDAADGYCHTFVVPEKTRHKSRVTGPLRKAAESAMYDAWTIPGLFPPEPFSKPSLARANADVPEWWTENWRDDKTHSLFYAAITTELAGTQAFPQHAGWDPARVDAVLIRAGRVLMAARKRVGDLPLHGVQAELGFATILKAICTETVSRNVSRGGAERRLVADIVVGSPARLVVEVKFSSDPFSGRNPVLHRSLSQLHGYILAFPDAFIALVLVGALPPEATEPRIEHTTTPSGHPVTVVGL